MNLRWDVSVDQSFVAIGMLIFIKSYRMTIRLCGKRNRTIWLWLWPCRISSEVKQSTKYYSFPFPPRTPKSRQDRSHDVGPPRKLSWFTHYNCTIPRVYGCLWQLFHHRWGSKPTKIAFLWPPISRETCPSPNPFHGPSRPQHPLAKFGAAQDIHSAAAVQAEGVALRRGWVCDRRTGYP